MAQQEEEWGSISGLQPLMRNRDLNCLLSFNTMFTASPTSSTTHSSSDLDSTESSASFFHEKGITFGSLIGVSSILELSKRSTKGRVSERNRNKKSYKCKSWFLSLCSKLSSDAVSIDNNTPSLGQFLEVERRTASDYKRNPSQLLI